MSTFSNISIIWCLEPNRVKEAKEEVDLIYKGEGGKERRGGSYNKKVIWAEKEEVDLIYKGEGGRERRDGSYTKVKEAEKEEVDLIYEDEGGEKEEVMRIKPMEHAYLSLSLYKN
ncbi:hypothetical protein RhiirA5_411450 [Rhizophagus irregularis]|uniref:Uncharacterized protein n=1 Tax=Rhizophagus irregularis TaxID=588596 RepID=A0A2N0Q0Z0_9GLOM|nr:hypothetical protein RhiirA5_411450 [Rhizophagus irregularis]